MLRIAICDDQMQQLREIRNLAENYIQRHQETATYTDMSTPLPFWKTWTNKNTTSYCWMSACPGFWEQKLPMK